MAPNINDGPDTNNNSSDNGNNLNHKHLNGINKHTKQSTTAEEFIPKIRWPDLLAQIAIHLGFIYGFYFLVTFQAKFYTYIWFLALIVMTGIGTTAGAHRLWSHKSYKIKKPLEIILLILFTMAGQRDAYTWAHDHRVHHKYSETDSDPHNINRGFFFAHIGWLFLTPHPKVVEKRKTIDMSDLKANNLVMLQKKIYPVLYAIFVIAIPTWVPSYFWNESMWISFWVSFVCRYCVVLNIAFCVNSVSHMYGDRPYDKHIMAVENLAVSIAAIGEGWHNYHHVFPWDYKTGEYGGWKGYKYNVTTMFLDFFSHIGWVYDRKSATPEMVRQRVLKTGDGTHYLSHQFAHNTSIWGYGDKDIPIDEQRQLDKMIT